MKFVKKNYILPTVAMAMVYNMLISLLQKKVENQWEKMEDEENDFPAMARGWSEGL